MCDGSNGDDVVLSTHVMTLCKAVHDSLNALSFDDDKRNAAVIICRSLDYFHFENSEQMLNYLVEARANFTNLDDVTEVILNNTDINYVTVPYFLYNIPVSGAAGESNNSRCWETLPATRIHITRRWRA